MTKAEGYRRQAEFCVQQARQHADPQIKQQFLMLQRQWLELAEQIVVLERNALNPHLHAGYGLRAH